MVFVNASLVKGVTEAMDWLQEYDFSDEEIRSVVAGMQEMSAVDGDVDPQELELIQQVAEGIEVNFL